MHCFLSCPFDMCVPLSQCLEFGWTEVIAPPPQHPKNTPEICGTKMSCHSKKQNKKLLFAFLWLSLLAVINGILGQVKRSFKFTGDGLNLSSWVQLDLVTVYVTGPTDLACFGVGPLGQKTMLGAVCYAFYIHICKCIDCHFCLTYWPLVYW